MEHDFQGNTTHNLACMRLMAEGAIVLYESEMGDIYRQLLDGGNTDAALAFDALGTALHEITLTIQEIQRRLVKTNS